jgi:hypothetical protein
MKTFILLLNLCFVSLFSMTAQAAQAFPVGTEACDGDYQEVVDLWQMQEPTYPGALKLGRAYLLYKNLLSVLSKIKNDKVKHCYIGCEIAKNIDYITAEYTGWLKEDRDLKDCNPRTKFDFLDYLATINGARISVSAPEVACLLECRQAALSANTSPLK